MKNMSFLLPALVFAGFTTCALAQATTVHEITLLVNTADFDPRNPAASCTFMAGEGTEVLVANPPEKFTIAAEVGDIIRWNGNSSSDPNVVIEIRKIKHDKGQNLFPAKEMDGMAVVEGTITRGNHGDDYKYIIFFKIGDTGAMHKIDPKIQVK
jgi:hypothetical protein